MAIALTADTHGCLPPALFERLSGVEAILHLGDLGPPAMLSELALLAPVTAVMGNVDSPGVPGLPARQRLERAGLAILLRHAPWAAACWRASAGRGTDFPIARRKGRAARKDPAGSGSRGSPRRRRHGAILAAPFAGRIRPVAALGARPGSPGGRGMTQRATQRQSALTRARELHDSLLALRHEQELLITELVWNEMRAKEIQLRLQAPTNPPTPDQRAALELDLRRRLELIRSLARWEQDADRSYHRQREALAALLAADPALSEVLPEAMMLLTDGGLASVARSAARELGLALDGGVDGC